MTNDLFLANIPIQFTHLHENINVSNDDNLHEILQKSESETQNKCDLSDIYNHSTLNKISVNLSKFTPKLTQNSRFYINHRKMIDNEISPALFAKLQKDDLSLGLLYQFCADAKD